MGLGGFLMHALDFLGPVVWLAVVLASTRFINKKSAPALDFKAQFALYFAVGCMVLLAGLWWFGRDGKMLTYLALALALATSHRLTLRR